MSEQQAECMQIERERRMCKVQRTTGLSVWFSDHVLQLSDWLIFSNERDREREVIQYVPEVMGDNKVLQRHILFVQNKSTCS